MGTLIERLRPKLEGGKEDVHTRRRAERSVADAYDPVSWNLQTIMYARRADILSPRSW